MKIKILTVAVDFQIFNKLAKRVKAIAPRLIIAEVEQQIIVADIRKIFGIPFGYRSVFYNSFELKPKQKFKSCIVKLFGNIKQTLRMSERTNSPIAHVAAPITLKFIGGGLCIFAVSACIHPKVIKRRSVFFNHINPFQNRFAFHSAPNIGAERSKLGNTFFANRRELGFDKSAPEVMCLVKIRLIRHNHNRGCAKFFAGQNSKAGILNFCFDRHRVVRSADFTVPLTRPTDSDYVA